MVLIYISQISRDYVGYGVDHLEVQVGLHFSTESEFLIGSISDAGV